jgi:hypothetical protein
MFLLRMVGAVQTRFGAFPRPRNPALSGGGGRHHPRHWPFALLFYPWRFNEDCVCVCVWGGGDVSMEKAELFLRTMHPPYWPSPTTQDVNPLSNHHAHGSILLGFDSSTTLRVELVLERGHPGHTRTHARTHLSLAHTPQNTLVVPPPPHTHTHTYSLRTHTVMLRGCPKSMPLCGASSTLRRPSNLATFILTRLRVSSMHPSSWMGRLRSEFVVISPECALRNS